MILLGGITHKKEGSFEEIYSAEGLAEVGEPYGQRINPGSRGAVMAPKPKGNRGKSL